MKTVETKVFSTYASQSSFVVNDTPDGSDITFTGTITLTSRYIKPGSLVLTSTISASPVTITDNGSGVLSGSGITGTINYGTGAYALTFTTPPDNSTDITGVYQYTVTTPIQITGGSTGVVGSNLLLSYEGNLLDDIVPGSVAFTINFSSTPVVFSDDINGNFSGTGLNYGYIEYQTGTFKLVFQIAPDNAAALTVTYQHRSTQPNEELIVIKEDNVNCLVVRHSHSSTQYFHLSESVDNISFTYVGTYYCVPGGLKILQISPRKYYRIYSSDCKLKCSSDIL